MKLTLEMLKNDLIKIPTPTCDQMMQMFQESWKGIAQMLATNLPSKQTHNVCTKLMDLIEKEMLEFREQFLSSKPTATLTELRAQMIKPEGVQMKGQTVKDQAPPGKGLEFVDGDGEDLDVGYLEDLENNWSGK